MKHTFKKSSVFSVHLEDLLGTNRLLRRVQFFFFVNLEDLLGISLRIINRSSLTM